MFESNSKKIDFKRNNEIIRKTINLDANLDCFILISYKNSNIGNIILNKILDSVLEKISNKNTYKDFSNALENINIVIKNLKETEKLEDLELDIIISILNKNNLLFSTLGNASCYLINRDQEIIEITEKNENKSSFAFISDGTLNDKEIVIMGTKRILNYLSQSDILDGLNTNNLEGFNTNIENILLSEIIDSNIGVYTLKFSIFEKIKNSKLDNIKIKSVYLFDNVIIKKLLAFYLITKEKIKKQSKNVKNFLFIIGILICLFIVYKAIFSVVQNTGSEKEKMEAKQELIKAKDFLKTASQNITDTKKFDENIKKVEDIALKIKQKNLYLNDVNKILDDLSIVKKQFNNVETFDENDNSIYKDSFSDGFKMLESGKKYYVITKKGVRGPIVLGKGGTKSDFNGLGKDEFFVDATFAGNKIMLLTSLGKIVSFSKSGYFNYEDVKGQTSWEEASNIESFGDNIYLLSKDKKQIYKHKLVGESYSQKEDFLKIEDSQSIGKILSIAIDGGVFILKNDLSMIKLFKSPYRIERLTINKLPQNYSLEKENGKIEIFTRNDLNYIYMFLNNKVWVFKANSTRYQDTKSLDYIGQIEGKTSPIIDFDVIHDGEITILNSSGVYKMLFEINQNKLYLK